MAGIPSRASTVLYLQVADDIAGLQDVAEGTETKRG